MILESINLNEAKAFYQVFGPDEDLIGEIPVLVEYAYTLPNPDEGIEISNVDILNIRVTIKHDLGSVAWLGFVDFFESDFINLFKEEIADWLNNQDRGDLMEAQFLAAQGY